MAMREVAVFLALFVAVFSAVPGGWKDVDINDGEVLGVVNSAIQEMDLSSNSMFQTKLMKLTAAKVQVCLQTICVFISNHW